MGFDLEFRCAGNSVMILHPKLSQGTELSPELTPGVICGYAGRVFNLSNTSKMLEGIFYFVLVDLGGLSHKNYKHILKYWTSVKSSSEDHLLRCMKF